MSEANYGASRERARGIAAAGTHVVKAYLEHLLGAENVAENVPMSQKTTFKIGGPARFFVTVKSRDVLVKLLSALDYIETAWTIIGGGANLLVNDDGFDGVVIRMATSDIVQNGNFVYADAGVNLAKVCMFARKNSLSGLEWLAGIPGTIGGAVYMNAGAYGSEMQTVTVCVDVLKRSDDEWKIETINAGELDFGYRQSIFQERRDWIILGAYIHLAHGEEAAIGERMDEIMTKRRKSLPTQPSGGSTFRRPRPDFYVGTTIDRLGMKGNSVGGAMISDRHAGFIVNTGGATCADVMELVKQIKDAVREDTGEELHMEYEVL
ncbi:MAG: UDP-N-acetylmuramate dehydrogenase [Firmicutes bacterium]|nr:UDP-N-acetylmuramate dehydrogenase [Bacillota bacterium]